MARSFRPSGPYTVAIKVLIPVETKVMSTKKKTFPDPKDVETVIFCSFKTYGGTENFSNDLYTIYDTATVETWWRSDITSDCRIYICETGESWDVISRPEDVDMRHQYMRFKVQLVGGKA